jgi:hypothetical protein
MEGSMASQKSGMSKKIGADQHRPASSSPSISPEQFVAEVRSRAHQIFLQRGSTARSPLEDWLQAEKELKTKYGILD